MTHWDILKVHYATFFYETELFMQEIVVLQELT